MKLLTTILICLFTTSMFSQNVSPKQLNLDKDQLFQFEQIQKNSMSQIKDIVHLMKKDPESYLKKRNEIWANADKEYQKVMTQEQYARYTKIIKSRNKAAGNQQRLAPVRKAKKPHQ